jgi:hypothetical protein
MTVAGRLGPRLDSAGGYAGRFHDDRPRRQGRLALPEQCRDRPRLRLAFAAPCTAPADYIEEQGLIVCQLDGAGRRIVTLVELAWATAPGDPNAEEAAAEQA